MWRVGANATTTLTTQVPLMIGGKTIAPGVYNVFVELKPGAWTLVLSNAAAAAEVRPQRQGDLYGSYNYDAKFDVARAPMNLDSLDQKLEEFTITFLHGVRAHADADPGVGEHRRHRADRTGEVGRARSPTGLRLRFFQV